MKLQWKKFEPVYIEGTPCPEDDYLGEIDLEKSLPVPCAVKIGVPQYRMILNPDDDHSHVDVLFVGNVNLQLGVYGCGTFDGDDIIEIALIEVEV